MHRRSRDMVSSTHLFIQHVLRSSMWPWTRSADEQVLALPSRCSLSNGGASLVEIQTVRSATKFCKDHCRNMYKSQRQGGGPGIGQGTRKGLLWDKLWGHVLENLEMLARETRKQWAFQAECQGIKIQK